jgi:hypothetical protein
MGTLSGSGAADAINRQLHALAVLGDKVAGLTLKHTGTSIRIGSVNYAISVSTYFLPKKIDL